jgi:hypothetical protein
MLPIKRSETFKQRILESQQTNKAEENPRAGEKIQILLVINMS